MNNKIKLWLVRIGICIANSLVCLVTIPVDIIVLIVRKIMWNDFQISYAVKYNAEVIARGYAYWFKIKDFDDCDLDEYLHYVSYGVIEREGL